MVQGFDWNQNIPTTLTTSAILSWKLFDVD